MVIASLVLCVAAQDKTTVKLFDMKAFRFQEVELRAVTSPGENQGTPSGDQNGTLPSWAAKLRIEMLGGTTQKIDLNNVLKMTVTDR